MPKADNKVFQNPCVFAPLRLCVKILLPLPAHARRLTLRRGEGFGLGWINSRVLLMAACSVMVTRYTHRRLHNQCSATSEDTMTLTSFLQTAEYVTFVVFTTAILVFSFVAYRRTKLRAFAFWIASSSMGLIQMSAWYIHIHSSPLPESDRMTFNVIYRLCYIVINVLGAIGSIMLIQHVLAERERKDKDAA
jgi:hypothetical protein